MIYFIILFQIFFSLIILYKINYLSTKINIYTNDNNLKKIPTIGSIFFLFSILIVFILSLFDTKLFFQNLFINSYRPFYIFFASFFLIYIVGVFDDKFRLGAQKRLFFFIFLTYINLLTSENINIVAISIKSLDFYFPLEELKFIFIITCVVLFINAFNFIDGINLNLSIYSLFLLFFFILHNHLVNLNIVVLISILFFTYLNYKNKIFFGNGGSYSLSFLFIYELIYAHKSLIINFETCIVLVLLPIVDLIRVASERIAKGKSPFVGDLNHFHHLLLERFGQKFTNIYTAIYYSFLLIFFFFFKIQFNFLFILFLVMFYLLLIFYLKFYKKKIKI